MAQRWQAVRFGGPGALELITADVPPPGPGPRAPGDEVIAAPITGGYATQVRVSASDVFAKPATLSFAAAAGLILVGSTAAELLQVAGVTAADTVLLHGAAGAVGHSALQQARLLGARVIGTAGEADFDQVRLYGGEPVRYGDGLEQRVRELALGGITVALDTVGADEAVDVSLALVPDRGRIVTTAAFARAEAAGFRFVGASNPDSAPYRARIRPHLLALAAAGRLSVPHPHPSGKLALIV